MRRILSAAPFGRRQILASGSEQVVTTFLLVSGGCANWFHRSCISHAVDTQSESPDCMEGTTTGIRHSANLTEKNATSTSTSTRPATHIQRKNKSVRFGCETDFSSFGEGKSPYPTPLKIFEEMQTPGTVNPASLEDLPDGENLFRCKILAEKHFSPVQYQTVMRDSVEQAKNATPTPEKRINTGLNENKTKVEASLCLCFKPASITEEEKNKGMETAYSQTQYFHKTPVADRPIIGQVAAHWNEDDDSHISPLKWWDGNGIPNSTTKCREDQKVSCHATPFEERLEKALSEGIKI